MIFKPTLIPTLVTLLLLVLLISLGFWQLDRARQKTALQQDFQKRTELPAVSMTSLDLAGSTNRYRKVMASGHYDTEHQILLDNQLRNGQPGYHVLTPLKIDANEMGWAILVNRGWVPAGASRQQLPDISVTDARVQIAGRLGQPANPGLHLPSSHVTHWPWVAQSIDYPLVSEVLGYRLFEAIILLDEQDPQGYLREWQPEFGRFGPERHHGYAVQWFALAFTLLIIYVVVNSKRIVDKQD